MYGRYSFMRMDRRKELTDNRGGSRKGAGAKKKDPLEKRVRTSIQIPAWLIDKIDQVAGKGQRSKTIVDILAKVFL